MRCECCNAYKPDYFFFQIGDPVGCSDCLEEDPSCYDRCPQCGEEDPVLLVDTTSGEAVGCVKCLEKKELSELEAEEEQNDWMLRCDMAYDAWKERGI